MARLTQVIQNTFIRLIAFLSVIFKKVWNLISRFFNAFANLFGLNKTSYFLDSEAVKSVNEYSDTQLIKTQVDTESDISNSGRRRPNAKMDYYIKMAREIQNK